MAVEQSVRSHSLIFCATRTEGPCAIPVRDLSVPRRFYLFPGEGRGPVSAQLVGAVKPIRRHGNWAPAFAGEQGCNWTRSVSICPNASLLIRKPPTPNAKGARHCCQAPCRRTAAVDPDGSSAWFRRLLGPRRQGQASFGPVVEAGRSPRVPREALRLPASAARFVSPAGTGNRKQCSDAVAPLDPLRPSTLLAQDFRLAKSPGGPFLRSRIRPLARPSPRTRVPHPFRIVRPHRAMLAHRLPLPLRSPFAWTRHSHFHQHLRAAFRARLQPHLRAALGFHDAPCLRSIGRFPVDPGSGVPQDLGSACAALRSCDIPRLRIPKPFPNAVSRRHLHRFRPV